MKNGAESSFFMVFSHSQIMIIENLMMDEEKSLALI